jgi:type I restriction enzyme S subunit
MGRDVSRDGKWVTPCIDFLTKEGARLSRFCEKGTLTIICSGDVGVPSFLAVDACIHDGFLALIDIDTSRIDVDYLYYCLVNLQRVFNSSATHGGVYNNLTTMILKEFSIGLPNLEEQNMIANCFSSLDSLLAEHTEKLDALKTHKKGLMQELFPRPEAVSE